MSSEKEDEFLSWRGRLDSPEGVPGQGLDHRERTWERLKDRLGGNPGPRLMDGPGDGRRLRPVIGFGSRRLLVYGVAAACLMLALIPASRLFQGRKSVFERGSVRQPAAAGAGPVEGQEVIRSSGPTVRLAASAPEDHQAGGSSYKARRRQSRVIAPIQLKTVAVIDDTIHTLEAPAAPLVSQLAPATAPPQKKWKVVDLSDLQGGRPAPHGMATNRTLLPLHIGFGNPDPPDGAGGGVSSTGDPGIRIKFSTSN